MSFRPTPKTRLVPESCKVNLAVVLGLAGHGDKLDGGEGFPFVTRRRLCDPDQVLHAAADGSHEPPSRLELLEQWARHGRGRCGRQDDGVVRCSLTPPFIAVANSYADVPIAQLTKQFLGLLAQGR